MFALIDFIVLLAQAESPGEDQSKGIGLGIILLTLLLVVLVIAGIWTFAAKRGSRAPGRQAHDRDRVGS
jgi:hypothetical protein